MGEEYTAKGGCYRCLQRIARRFSITADPLRIAAGWDEMACTLLGVSEASISGGVLAVIARRMRHTYWQVY